MAVLVSAVLVFGACGGDEEPEPEAAAESPQTEGSEEASAFPPEDVAALEEVLLVSYKGAAGYSASNDNYFGRNLKEKGELAGAVSVALSEEDTGVGSGYAEEDELDFCSRYPDAPMVRITTSEDGDDLILAASDNEMVVRLTYEVGSEPAFGEPMECES